MVAIFCCVQWVLRFIANSFDSLFVSRTFLFTEIWRAENWKNRLFHFETSLKIAIFWSWKKNIFFIAVSCIPLNIAFCSTHEYYKLANFEAQGSLHFRDFFVSKLKFSSLMGLLLNVKMNLPWRSSNSSRNIFFDASNGSRRLEYSWKTL